MFEGSTGIVAWLSKQVWKYSMTPGGGKYLPGPISARIKCKAKELSEGTEPSLSFGVHLRAATGGLPSTDLEVAIIPWGMGRSRGLGTA